ncbi:hypothetical protein MMYC01_202498 [Madurella mycetomatis]|uniref:Uncharacterized protein n=1 Tax=Madurella mycetomatis TaxID=100816 RepID=A0A175WCR2_9PEZI|nr:hypothetical protein MMYC01_202498 [Madurella mycetomatis]
MVLALSSMLNTDESRYADVLGAKKHMNFETARCLSRYLLGEEFAGKWYYCSDEKSKNPRLDSVIQGLGCEGVELTNMYWAILRRYKLIRTAEEEERRRFTAAPLVTVSKSTFATSVYRLFRACLRACPTTKDMAINFVQAGQLRLQLFFSEAERLFLVHDRWLSVDGAIMELGLPDGLMEADIIFHTVKRLFADALEQLPSDVFPEDNSKMADGGRELEIKRAEQRLLSHLLLNSSTVHTILSRPALSLNWVVTSPQQNFEVQCHKASRCAYLWDSLLTAEDARSDKMPCIAPKGEDSPEQRTDQNKSVIPSVPTCRVCRSGHSEGWHYEYGLEEDEEYFFVLVTPSDPTSFVGLSSVKRTDAHPQPRSTPSIVPTSRPSFIAIGPRLQSLDILAIDTDRWYEERSFGNMRAVIGIVNGEKYLPDETRKRRRVQEDQ